MPTSITTWMAAGLAARERGVPLVNIAQPFANTALQMVCSEESGVTSTDDFPGKTLGVWFFGNEYPFYAWMAKLGLSTDGGEDGVEVLRQAFSADPLLQGQADLHLRDALQRVQAGARCRHPEDSLTLFDFTEERSRHARGRPRTCSRDRLEDPEFVDQMVRFVRASHARLGIRQGEPGGSSRDRCSKTTCRVPLTLESQVYQVNEAAALVGDSAALDPAAYEPDRGRRCFRRSRPTTRRSPRSRKAPIRRW